MEFGKNRKKDRTTKARKPKDEEPDGDSEEQEDTEELEDTEEEDTANSNPPKGQPKGQKDDLRRLPAGLLKRGQAAQEQLARAKKEAKERREMGGRTYRFWLPESGGEAKITFLDGDLDDDGYLDIAYAWEHNVPFRATRENFICPEKNEHEDQEPCPICAKGDDPSYIGFLTILLHEDWEDKRDKKKHTYRRRIFAGKPDIIGKLQKRAKRHKGLAGCTFEVSRSGPRDFRTGGDFDFEEKNDIEDIRPALEKPEHADPVDYRAELLFLSAEELLDRGVGAKAAPVVGADRPRKRREGRGKVGDEL